MIYKVKLANGQEIEVPQSEIERAYLAAHPTPAPTGTGTTPPTAGHDDLRATVVALRDTVSSLSTSLQQERTERAQERAEIAVDTLIGKGKIPAANRDHWIKVYLSDRSTFDALTKVLPANNTRRVVDPDDPSRSSEFGTGGGADEGGTDDDDADGVALSNTGRSAAGGNAERQWLAGVEKIKKDLNLSDRQAGEMLSQRDPALWHRYREALAGERLPRIQQRNNRHMMQ
jgi:hypothetical protein